MTKPDIKMDDDDLANVLVALRYWQEALTAAERGGYNPVPKFQDMGYFDNAEVYEPDAIDNLCERINFA